MTKFLQTYARGFIILAVLLFSLRASAQITVANNDCNSIMLQETTRFEGEKYWVFDNKGSITKYLRNDTILDITTFRGEFTTWIEYFKNDSIFYSSERINVYNDCPIVTTDTVILIIDDWQCAEDLSDCLEANDSLIAVIDSLRNNPIYRDTCLDLTIDISTNTPCQLRVSPNPSTGYIYVEIIGNFVYRESFLTQVVTMKGEILFEREHYGRAIEINDLEGGFVKVITRFNYLGNNIKVTKTIFING